MQREATEDTETQTCGETGRRTQGPRRHIYKEGTPRMAGDHPKAGGKTRAASPASRRDQASRHPAGHAPALRTTKGCTSLVSGLPACGISCGHGDTGHTGRWDTGPSSNNPECLLHAIQTRPTLLISRTEPPPPEGNVWPNRPHHRRRGGQAGPHGGAGVQA